MLLFQVPCLYNLNVCIFYKVFFFITMLNTEDNPEFKRLILSGTSNIFILMQH